MEQLLTKELEKENRKLIDEIDVLKSAIKIVKKD